MRSVQRIQKPEMLNKGEDWKPRKREREAQTLGQPAWHVAGSMRR
jgi:hypothetical protein